MLKSLKWVFLSQYCFGSGIRWNTGTSSLKIRVFDSVGISGICFDGIELKIQEIRIAGGGIVSDLSFRIGRSKVKPIPGSPRRSHACCLQTSGRGPPAAQCATKNTSRHRIAGHRYQSQPPPACWRVSPSYYQWASLVKRRFWLLALVVDTESLVEQWLLIVNCVTSWSPHDWKWHDHRRDPSTIHTSRARSARHHSYQLVVHDYQSQLTGIWFEWDAQLILIVIAAGEFGTKAVLVRKDITKAVQYGVHETACPQAIITDFSNNMAQCIGIYSGWLFGRQSYRQYEFFRFDAHCTLVRIARWLRSPEWIMVFSGLCHHKECLCRPFSYHWHD